MSKAKKGLLPRVEILIVIIFFLSFIAWAVSKCNATKMLYTEQDQEANVEEPIVEDTIVPPAAPATAPIGQPTTNPAAPATPGTVANPASPGGNTPPANPTSKASTDQASVLYVTIDGLNMRATPELEGTILTQLALYEKVTFMNEVTDSTQEINLGKIVADEPWVKVRNSKGKTGWVYGAGVHYYKMKHPGTIE